MTEPIRVVHYLNQFFAGVGGEEKAYLPPQWMDGAKGPGILLQRLAPQMEIVGTLVAGDNYVAEHLESATNTILNLLRMHCELPPQLILAGPAFNAGRYGMACASVCQAVTDHLDVPALTALYKENPAVDSFRRQVTIVKTAADVMGMQEAIQRMIHVGEKLVHGESPVPDQDHTVTRGIRDNFFADKTGSERAVAMLLAKLKGIPYETEYVMPVFDRVPPAPAVADVSACRIALVTSGGIVPRGNPDHIESANASKFGAYSLEGLERLSSETHQSVHGGYDPTYANEDPNRVLPLDAVRILGREGRIGSLSETYYATVGNATSVARARRYGEEIAALLINEGVQAVIFTST
jgi:glycine reductase